MRKLPALIILVGCAFTFSDTAVTPQADVTAVQPQVALIPQFTFTDATGQQSSVPFVDESEKRQLAAPFKKFDERLDPALTKAATIAQERAHARSKSKCWRYVKRALLASGAISSYPKTELAKQAGDELVREHGFEKLPITDPHAAPVGAVIVYYKGAKLPGHVEIRAEDGFVSDFKTKHPSPHPVIGIYAKASI
ncbi:MAG TPA: hypothetical protein VK993_02285 [Chthoniobacterales bacterium]|nr:hypothetical protein [Chthoniobacterales bacterium]